VGGDSAARDELVFGAADSVSFSSGWEMLLGQGEVQNWVRSSPGKAEHMRYPGEWKFAGGVLEPGESPEEAAVRELQEEFMVHLPKERAACKLHLLTVMQTRPVRNVSYIMYNFVAAAEENPWLEQLDSCAVNSALEKRRVEHAAILGTGAFWDLDKPEREQVSPEVRELSWLDMRSAVLNAYTSMNSTLTPANAFQAEEFARLAIARRDPMFVTMALLLEVESFPTLRSLVRHTASLDPELVLQQARWLEHGMSPEEVAQAWQTWQQGARDASRSFTSAEGLALLRAEGA